MQPDTHWNENRMFIQVHKLKGVIKCICKGRHPEYEKSEYDRKIWTRLQIVHDHLTKPYFEPAFEAPCLAAYPVASAPAIPPLAAISADTNVVLSPNACTRLTSTRRSAISRANSSSTSASAAARARMASASAFAARRVACADASAAICVDWALARALAMIWYASASAAVYGWLIGRKESKT